VLVEDGELVEIQQAARRQRQSVAECIRAALRAARAAAPGRAAADKLQALNAGTVHGFPTRRQ